MFSKTTSILTTLYLELDDYFSFFLKNYALDEDHELLFDSFKLTFQHMPIFFASGLSRMVFEHFQDYFHPKNSMNGFPQLF